MGAIVRVAIARVANARGAIDLGLRYQISKLADDSYESWYSLETG